ncbi:holin [Clostridium sp. FP2]|uniref:holin n=1 Tax=Clostridium TaxID=1485 RepID=UPI0013E9877E|nr:MULTISPECIES: holin [Clostridium]MBW9155938.1 holin [Clostridium tagluense]MBZ9624096.1 holin [Clostridium sp. FP2]WLC63986.1 holin [Clostridium tagluense]
MDKSRFKNVGLWVSIFAFIGLILGNYGLYSVIGLTAVSYKMLVDAFLGILTISGILSNPNSGTGYLDK